MSQPGQSKYYSLYAKAIKQNKANPSGYLNASVNVEMMQNLNSKDQVQQPMQQKPNYSLLNIKEQLLLSVKAAIKDINNQQISYNQLYQTNFNVIPRLTRLHEDFQMFFDSETQNDKSVADIRLNQYKAKFSSELNLFTEKQMKELEKENAQLLQNIEIVNKKNTEHEVQIDILLNELDLQNKKISEMQLQKIEIGKIKDIKPTNKKTNQTKINQQQHNNTPNPTQQLQPHNIQFNQQCSSQQCQYYRAYSIVKKQLENQKEIQQTMLLEHEKALESQYTQFNITIKNLQNKLNENRGYGIETCVNNENELLKSQKDQLNKFEWENQKLSQENNFLHTKIRQLEPMDDKERQTLQKQLHEKQQDLKDCQDQVDLLIEEIQKLGIQ